jgi:hypothetical protein
MPHGTFDARFPAQDVEDDTTQFPEPRCGHETNKQQTSVEW